MEKPHAHCLPAVLGTEAGSPQDLTHRRYAIIVFKNTGSQAPVAHAYNPSYSGGRDQEDHGSKPDQTNSSRDPISKKPITKRAGGVAQDVGPEFKAPVPQK
jgi:hypothetical protein